RAARGSRHRRPGEPTDFDAAATAEVSGAPRLPRARRTRGFPKPRWNLRALLARVGPAPGTHGPEPGAVPPPQVGGRGGDRNARRWRGGCRAGRLLVRCG